MRRKLPRCIGVVHLPPLPGSPGAAGLHPAAALERAGQRAVLEARALEKAGFDGIILENFGDAPFYGASVPPETLVAMSVISAAVREAVRLPVGINILRNDARGALAVAAITGADFIRVNVLSGVMATDQGIIEGGAAELLRERARLNADDIGILADVHVKHAKSLSSDDLALAIEETSGRGGADGIIITGSTTGRAPSSADLHLAWKAAKECKVPLYIGSGLQASEVLRLPSPMTGMIVGSTLRRGGKAGAPLDSARIRTFMKAVKSNRTRNGKTRRASS
jgi:membrane complex biogenesis BtpA family protein